MLFVPVNNNPGNSEFKKLLNRLYRWCLCFFKTLLQGLFCKPRCLKRTRVVLLCAGALLLYPALTGGDALSQSSRDKPGAGAGKKVSPRRQAVKGGGEPCSSPCTNSARAPRITPAEVVRGRALLECAAVHFGGFIPGYGGFEIFGVGRDNCPAVETYVPSHFGAVPAPCRDCEWQDGSTIRERENACSQQLNFVFVAMPNCVRGDWVNTSERVRTCSRERTCHRSPGAGRLPGKGSR